MGSQQSSTLHQQRVIRVFVSSTFRDMRAERDELIKRVFPQLRKLCEGRAVTWAEVDLRWGVTDEQKAEGKVLPICLAEIQRCRPYFIGLLGERYGWVPEEISPELIEREPWLAEQSGRSVTELEILHGVLNNTAMAGHGLFYFRDSSFINALPGEQQADFLELATANEIQRLGQEEAERRAADRRRRLLALKDHIRQSGLPVRENYPSPEALGEMVLRDLTGIIDRRYPARALDPLDRDALDHEAFGQSRARVYVGRQDYFERLNQHALSEEPPLVILGESGSGKSALLSNWALEYRKAHPEDLLVMQFIGATPRSTDWAAMVRRILGEFKRHFDIPQEIPYRPDELRAAFATWLHTVARMGRVLLIVDGLNQLEDREGAPDLVWLPPVIPSNVRLIVSTLPGRALDELTRRSWPTMEVRPLEPHERKQLIRDYLAEYTKTLAPERVERIASADQTANPLFLRALLEELRVFGIHEQLDERVEHYLKAATIPELYGKILARYEADYERDHAGLVGEAFSLVWGARRGLTEGELLELLGSNGRPLAGGYWAPLSDAADRALLSRSGLITFSHEYLRAAVTTRYLFGDEQQRVVHARIASYFGARQLGSRKLDELPWQLAALNAWGDLADALADPAFIDALVRFDRYEAHGYWAQVEANSPKRMLDVYRNLIDAPPVEALTHLWSLNEVLANAGHLKEALKLTEAIFKDAALGEPGFPPPDEVWRAEARMYLQIGDLDSALAVSHALVTAMRTLKDNYHLQLALETEAAAIRDCGDRDAALDRYREQERICAEGGYRLDRARSLDNQATLLFGTGKQESALELNGQAQAIFREFSNLQGLHNSLGNQAVMLMERGDLAGAAKCIAEKREICERLGDSFGLQHTLGLEGNMLAARGDHQGALALTRLRQAICVSSDNRKALQAAIGEEADELYALGERPAALERLREKERICREIGLRQPLINALERESVIAAELRDFDSAIAYIRHAQSVCNEIGDDERRRACRRDEGALLCSRAAEFIEHGAYADALKDYEEAERLTVETSDKQALQFVLGNKGRTLLALGREVEALVAHENREKTCREIGDARGCKTALMNQILILERSTDFPKGIRAFNDLEDILRADGDNQGLAETLVRRTQLLGRAAEVAAQGNDFEGALTAYRDQTRVWEMLKEPQPWAESLANQAVALDNLGRAKDALPLAERARHIAAGAGLVEVSAIQALVEHLRARAKKSWNPFRR